MVLQRVHRDAQALGQGLRPQTLLLHDRRELHMAVAKALEREVGALERAEAPAADELSYHAYSAGAWAKAVSYGSRAGQRALSMHAPRAAVEHFGRSVEAAQKLGQRPALEVLRGRG
jgi:predicted ATPase